MMLGLGRESWSLAGRQASGVCEVLTFDGLHVGLGGSRSSTEGQQLGQGFPSSTAACQEIWGTREGNENGKIQCFDVSFLSLASSLPFTQPWCCL